MTKCRWDSDAEDYLIDGEPCRVDEYGDPTRHCKARRTCSVHIGADELTCPRCIGRTRANLRRIVTLSALLMPVAVASGSVNTSAAWLAGPAAQPVTWTDRRIAMRAHLAAWERLGRISEQQHLHARRVMDESDDRHPLNVLGTWDMMIREDYGHPSDQRVTVSNAADYLDRQLARIANDREQDWPLFAAEIRKCRRHLEDVVALAARQERGAPCPACHEEGVEKPPRLVKQYGHWCDDGACEKVHHDDDTDDVWECRRNREHWWTEHDYRLRVADWYDEARDATA